MSPLKVGWIDYLNSLPIYHGLATGDVATPAGVTFVKDTPTALNAGLMGGALDVSPISSIAYARHADELVMLPDLSINSVGFVHSVCLFYRNGLDSLEHGKIAITAQSATSEVLLKILLEKKWGLEADLLHTDPDPERIGDDVDAVLLIGDDAMRCVLAYPELGRVDLGEEWSRWTNTPMVFALWAARREVAAARPNDVRAVHDALVAGRHWGRAHRGEIIDHARRRVFLSRAFMARYFRDLRYDLDAPKLAGLARFYDLAHEVGALDRVPSLDLLEATA